MFLSIVAVHGLLGHYMKSWTHNQTKKMWLRDFLPDQIPRSRIMTFGYDARVTGTRNVIGIQENAGNLLEALTTLRRNKEERKRPIIFIGHSLGGIVIKKALIIARGEKPYTLILDATYAVIFMGTPHHGSRLADIGKQLVSMARVSGLNFSTVNLQDLERDSRVLQDIARDFGHLPERIQYTTVAESEATPLPYTNSSVLVVPTSSARLNLGPRERIFNITGADHINVCKFSAKEDTQYSLIWNSLADAAERAIELDLVNESAISTHQAHHEYE